LQGLVSASHQFPATHFSLLPWLSYLTHQRAVRRCRPSVFMLHVIEVTAH
jgi:hypothetical protein